MEDLAEEHRAILIALFPDKRLSKRGLGREIQRDLKTADKYAQELRERGWVDVEGETVDKVYQDTIFLTGEGRAVAEKVAEEERERLLRRADEIEERRNRYDRMSEE